VSHHCTFKISRTAQPQTDQSVQLQLDNKGGSDSGRTIHQLGIGEEQRRNSAPEIEEWQRPDEDSTPTIPTPKVVQRLTQSAIAPQPPNVEPNPTQGGRLPLRCLDLLSPSRFVDGTKIVFGL